MTYYTVQIDSGTAPGPYSIFYNTFGTFASWYPTGQIPSGLTLSQLYNGVIVYSLQDDINTIYLYNEQCDTTQTFSVSGSNTGKDNYPCICVVITDTLSYSQNILNFCYNYLTINGKPQYQTSDGLYLTWNLNGYWEIPGFTIGLTQFRSNDFDDIPNSNWFGFGPNASNFTLISQVGDCNTTTSPSISVNSVNPSCFGVNDGSITASAIGGSGGWTYSLDNILYSNTVGIFTSLGQNQYTVYAKDSNNLVISQLVTLVSTSVNNFSIPGSINVTTLPSVGNMIYKLVTIDYNTSLIPVGQTVSFDLNVLYNKIYSEPGYAVFDTSTQYVTKNGNQLVISQSSSNPFGIVGPSSCNPIYDRYGGSDTYMSNNVTLENGDVFSVNVVYGIDTQTNGNYDGQCYTNASVIINLTMENVTLTCSCCSLNNIVINVSQPTQIYFSIT